MRKRWPLIVLLVVVLLAGGGYTYYRLVLTSAQAEEQPTIQTTQAYQGSIVISVDGTGNLMPAAEVNVGFQTSGLLVELDVQVGDHVEAGQVLGRLDTTDLELAVEKAKAQLDQAQAGLDSLSVGPSDSSVVSAQTNLSDARANLTEQQVSLAAATERARLSWVTAANNLRDAQASYSEIYWSNRSMEQKLADSGQSLPQSNVDDEAAAWHAVENAQASMDSARLSYETAQQQEQTTLQTARGQVSTAQSSLDALYVGASASEVVSAQSSLTQAQIAYEQAQAGLDKAVLKAPISGTVMSVGANVGEQVGTGSIITIDNLDTPLLRFWVEESSLSSVKVGERIEIIFTALPDSTYTGKITRIEPALVTVNNTSALQVWATMDQAPTEATTATVSLLSGMAADVTVVEAEADNVVVVPLQALRELGNDQYGVFVVGTDGSQQLRPVQLGLQDEVSVEIRSGLQAGEVVSLGVKSSTSTAASSTTDQNPFGQGGFEGGFGPGMGPVFMDGGR